MSKTEKSLFPRRIGSQTWLGRATCPVLLLGMALSPAVCVACRYTVRDVGFVETTPSTYRLVLPPGVPPDLRSMAEVTFLETPIQLAEDSPLREGDKPSGMVLKSPWGEELALSVKEELPGESEAARSFLGTLAQSPARERLVDLLVEHYAVVALVESRNPDLNREASGEIEAAIRGIEGTMASMPKAVGAPPVLFPIHSDEFETEKVLAWSLGGGDTLPKAPVAAVVYGRGRRLGDPMVGAEINEAHVHHLLSLVGFDCECGLDRKSLEGVALPVRWDEAARRRAAKMLGFDPDNPLVRMEINQILTRGPAFGKREGMEADPLLGYSEQVYLPGTESPTRVSESAGDRIGEVIPATLDKGSSGAQPSKPSGSVLNWTLGLFPVLVLAGGLMVLLHGRWREG